MINTEIISSINDAKINAELDVVTAILESYSKTLDILSETNGEETIIQESVLFMEASSEKTGDKSSGNKKFLNSLLDKIKGVINTIIEGFRGVIDRVYSSIKFKNTGDMYQLYNDLELIEYVSKIQNKRASTNTPTQEYFYALDENDNIIFQEYDELIDDEDDDIFQEGWGDARKKDKKINDEFMAKLENADPDDIYAQLQKILKPALEDHYSASLRSGVIKKSDIISMLNTIKLISENTGTEADLQDVYEQIQQLSKSGDIVENARACAKFISGTRIVKELANKIDNMKAERGSLATRTGLAKIKEKDPSFFENISESQMKYFEEVQEGRINNMIEVMNKQDRILKDFLNVDPQKLKPMDHDDVSFLLYGGSPAGRITNIGLVKDAIKEFISKKNDKQNLFSRISTSLEVIRGLIRNEINAMDNYNFDYNKFSDITSKRVSLLSKTFESIFTTIRLLNVPFNIQMRKLEKNINEARNNKDLNTNETNNAIKQLLKKAKLAVIRSTVFGVFIAILPTLICFFLTKLIMNGAISAGIITSLLLSGSKLSFIRIFKIISKSTKAVTKGVKKIQKVDNVANENKDEHDIDSMTVRAGSRRGAMIYDIFNKKDKNNNTANNTAVNNTANNTTTNTNAKG